MRSTYRESASHLVFFCSLSNSPRLFETSESKTAVSHQLCDGHVVAHTIVMALATATHTGDIDDWFPDNGFTSVKSIDYLPSIHQHLIEAHHLLLGTVDMTIHCGEQPRMKKRLSEMQHNIATRLGISPDQVHVKVSSMDGNDEIARLEGIEARVIVSLWMDL